MYVDSEYFEFKIVIIFFSVLQLELPGSKSLSNRILLLSALCKGNTKISNILDSEDIHYMISALQQLKVCLSHHPRQVFSIIRLFEIGECSS
jgi:5-enolpyruvylshikimate-3-phosphate synthase